MANLMDIGAAHQAYGNTTKMPNMRAAQTHQQARKIAEDFEAVFLSQMLQPMFEVIKPEAPFGGGNAELARDACEAVDRVAVFSSDAILSTARSCSLESRRTSPFAIERGCRCHG